MTEDQKELMRRRVDAAVTHLNEVLADAHRFGFRSRVHSHGGEDRQTVGVALMLPVKLTWSE